VRLRWRNGPAAFLVFALVAGLVVSTASLRAVNLRLRLVNEERACGAAAGLQRASLRRAKAWAGAHQGWEAKVRRPEDDRGRVVTRLSLLEHTDPGFQPGPLSRKAFQGKGHASQAKELFDRSVDALSAGKVVWWRSRPGRPERVGCALARGRQVVLVESRPDLKGFTWPWATFFVILALGAVLVLVGAALGHGLPANLGLGLGLAVAWVGLSAWYASVASAPLGSPLSLGDGLARLFDGWNGAVTLGLGLVVLAVAGGRALGWGRGIVTALREHRVAYAYVLPAAAGMLVLVLVPFLFGLLLGFFNHCEGHFEYIGLRNFREILSGGGAPLTHPLNFYFTLAVTLLWTTVNVLLHTGIGLGLALLLNNPTLRFKGIYRMLLIIPWAVPNYITALMWKGMFHQQYGAVNQVLHLLGIAPVSWFSHFWSAFTANVVTNTWLGFPFMMVVCLGALQSIPKDLYEAAEVDGAGRWVRFRHITWPLLQPALLPAVILGSIWTFNMFNVIYLVSGGEPGGSTDILITEAYRWAFLRYERYGLAAAYAALIFVILLGYSYLTSRVTRKAREAAQ